MPRRRKRRSRSSSSSPGGLKLRAMLAGISLLMLVFICVLIVPAARRQHISTEAAFGLAALMWAFSVLAIWVCIRSRRRRYRHGRASTTMPADYSDFEEDEVAEPGEADGHGH